MKNISSVVVKMAVVFVVVFSLIVVANAGNVSSTKKKKYDRIS
jgi:hypothetical protein